MIPKVIHYCWFGGKPLPPLAEKCIASWKKYLPDYEIKRWDESTFDVNMIPYTQQAYEAKKYAFVSDYARFWILYNYGGIYFDTDVEVIRPIDDLILKGNFMGCEQNSGHHYPEMCSRVNPGLGFAANKGNAILKELMDNYSSQSFKLSDNKNNYKTIVDYTTELLFSKGLRNSQRVQLIQDIYVYPTEFFCPINYKTKKLEITDETRTIHHFAASWVSNGEKIKIKIKSLIGKRISHLLYLIKHKIYG